MRSKLKKNGITQNPLQKKTFFFSRKTETWHVFEDAGTYIYIKYIYYIYMYI